MTTPDREQALGGFPGLSRDAYNEACRIIYAWEDNSDLDARALLEALMPVLAKGMTSSPDTVSTNEVRDE